MNGVPSGSYVVEIASPSYAFEPARVEITSKGKMRARRVNNVHISDLQMLAYPLRFKARAYASYFQQREQLRITDLLMNPMVRNASQEVSNFGTVADYAAFSKLRVQLFARFLADSESISQFYHIFVFYKN